MNRLQGFSLMEMMIVLTIVAIVAAASAPMMNKKMVRAASEKSPWVFVNGSESIGYNIDNPDGIQDRKTATIGRNGVVPNGAGNPRLYIDTNSDATPHILFGKNGGSLIRLIAGGDNNNIWLSNNSPNEATSNSVVIGSGTRAANNGGIAIGRNTTAAENNSIAMGHSAAATNTDSIAIGHSAVTSSNDNKTSASNAIAIGHSARVTNDGGVAIGLNTSAADNAIAIGSSGFQKTEYHNVVNTSATAANSIAIGYSAEATGQNSIAIGSPTSIYYGGITSTTSTAANSLAIGPGANAFGDSSIAIGRGAFATNQNTIAIGTNAGNINTGRNNIFVGADAGRYVLGSNKICIGNDVGPKSAQEANSNDEMIYIGGKPKVTPKVDKSWAKEAVMVIHNASPTDISIGSNRMADETGPTVYINGNLCVRGYIFAVLRGDDNNEEESFSVLGNKNGNNNGEVKAYNVGDDMQKKSPSDYAIASVSDRRLKNVGKAFVGGLAELKKLDLYHYTFKDDKGKTPHVGVMAQDLQKIFPDAVTKGEDGFLRIRMEDMFYALINAVKELDIRTSSHDKKIQELEKQNAGRLKRIETLQKRN